MKKILTILATLTTATANSQDLKLSAIIENTEPCNLEKELLNKKIGCLQVILSDLNDDHKNL